MKNILFPLGLLLLGFTSCKEECKTCEIEVFYNGEINEDLGTVDVYCGEVLEVMENEPKTTIVGPIRRVRTCKNY
tara:strand:+ start:2393 stop:2617 length:225 start_codon:yes stop_codon:yes gene_type:complete